MVFLATEVAAGTALAVVVATGMNTEVGHIATLLETASSELTPLQRRLDQVGRRLLWACLAIVLVVFGLGVIRGIDRFELFLGAVSLAVAAIPEGLPAVVTIALALGVQRMARRDALVRRLAAVETLGCVGVICTDKTGTLTVGEMTVRKIVIGARIFNVTGEGYATDGAIIADGNAATARSDPQLGDLLRAAVACNDAQLNDRAGVTSVVGDPTEGALLVAAAKAGLGRHEVASANPRLAAIPFSSDRKRMTVICRRDGETAWAFAKGAPEVIFERCSRMRVANATEELSPADRASMLQASALMANDALRVLAFAQRRLDSEATAGQAAENADDVERDLTLLGLVGLQDPPRAEAREAIARCRRAGIRPVMITGDHPDTARAIARELGILEVGTRAMLGRELDAVTDAELAEHVKLVAVYARVTAEHKLRIVRAWKANGAVVAMTGDGVNDAPALKEAAIGVAMGITGTEVAKEAADIIIADDNFASIVAAVEEGRGIYDNVVKTLAYLMGGNAAELALMLVAAMVGWPLPLLPIQLLWINLVTDGLPALALATDTIDSDVMSRPPRDPRSQIMDRSFFGLLALTGFLTAAVALTAFGWEFWVDRKLADARNAAFSALVIAELLRSFGARSSTRTIWESGLLTNLRLFAVVAASFSLQLAIHHVAWLEGLFGTEPITLGQCAGWIALGTLPLLTLELRKWLLGPRRSSTPKTVTS
jgi:Ca2+-transporting ATPase